MVYGTEGGDRPLDALNQILSSYAPRDIILLVLLLIAAIKFFGPGVQWIYAGLHSHFKKQDILSASVNERAKITETIANISDKVDALSDAMIDLDKQTKELAIKINDIDLKNDRLQEQLENVASLGRRNDERLTEYMKAFIIDRYHYYCYQAKKIDDISLQYLEVCFSYLQSNKDSGYLQTLMSAIRALPKINLENSDIS